MGTRAPEYGGWRTSRLSHTISVTPSRGDRFMLLFFKGSMKNKREQALVHPPKGGKMHYRQSRFSHLAPVPFRVLAAGRTGSGKTSALFSAVTDHYRGCFSKIVIIARTAFFDHSYVELAAWAAKHLRQDQTEAPFVCTSCNRSAK